MPAKLFLLLLATVLAAAVVTVAAGAMLAPHLAAQSVPLASIAALLAAGALLLVRSR